MIDHLDAAVLPALARGCALLGAGGGGDTGLGLAMAAHAIAERGPVAVVAAAELPPEVLVMPCGQLGAAGIAEERIWSGDEGWDLLHAVEGEWGVAVAALMCLEIGGGNGLLPIAWAARLGLPLLDADGKGRALPGLHRQAMHLGGIPASPVIAADGRGNVLVLRGADDGWAGRLALGAAASFGGVCAVAHSCLTAGQARGAVIHGSITAAIALGDASDRRGVSAPGARLLIEGRVVDVSRGTAEATRQEGASATVRGGGYDARELRLELQHEYLVAFEDGAVQAAVPDVICVLAAETGAPVAADAIRHGQRVSVVALPGPDVWRTEPGRALAGPAAFGYDLDGAPRGDGWLDAGR